MDRRFDAVEQANCGRGGAGIQVGLPAYHAGRVIRGSVRSDRGWARIAPHWTGCDGVFV